MSLIDPLYVSSLSKEECAIFRMLLAKYQFTPAMIHKLRGSCVVFNDDIGDESVQIFEFKNRAGPIPDTKRGHTVVFTKRKERFEYSLVKQYYNTYSLHCQLHHHDIETTTLITVGHSGKSIKSLGFLEQHYDSIKWGFSEKASYFLRVWCKAKEDTKNNETNKFLFSLGFSTISQTQKTMMFDYQIIKGGDGELPVNNEIENNLGANQRVHTHKTDINVYEARNVSPIMLEADHKVGRQVANLFTEEARRLGAGIKTMTLSQIRQAYGLDTPSDQLNNGGDLKEILDKTGCDVTDYLGIKREDDIVIVKHPLVLAIMKKYIKHIDSGINELIMDQQSANKILTDKVIQIEARRVVVASLIEQFDETLHADAKKILDEYEIPTFPPLV